MGVLEFCCPGSCSPSAVARTWSAELYLHGEMAGWGKVSRNSSPDFDTPLAGLEVPSFQKWMLSEKARELFGRGEPPVLPGPIPRALLAVGKPRPFRSRMAHSFSTVGCVSTVSSRSLQGGRFAWVEGLRAAAVGVVQQ